jgi:hypothetical protein
MIRKKREKILFWIVVVLLVFTGGYLYIFEGLVDNWTELNDEIDTLKSQLDNMQDNFSRKKDISEKYTRVTHNLHIAGSEEEQRTFILNEINSLLASSGLEPKTRVPLPTEVDGNFKMFFFDLPDIDCTPDKLFLFLNLLEEFSSVLEVDRLIVRNFDYDGLDVTFRVDIKLSRLVYSEETEEASRKGKTS